MSQNISRAFRATTLTYSSPAVATTIPEPTCFYNAFPDLNDMAPDGSQSAFPQRAKYNLALDSTFLPSAIYVNSNSLDEDSLASLDSRIRKVYGALIDKHRHEDRGLCLPRTPELVKIHYLHSLFEISHKRLAATDYTWAFRTYYLGPFYTALENHLVRRQKIDIPLVNDDSHRTSQLQRRWKAVKGFFKSTVLLNEAVSLLVCVTLLPPPIRKEYEEAWVGVEEGENSGFTDFYEILRFRFDPENCISVMDRSALAEQILKHAKRELSTATRQRRNDSLAEEMFSISMTRDMKNQRVIWPRLFGEEIHHGLRQLRVDLIPYKVVARISIPEAMQWIMALFSVLDDKKRSFTHQDGGWPEYVVFSLESGEDSAHPCITSVGSLHLQLLIHLGIKKADGSEIDTSQNRAPADTFIARSICRYTIFLESIRQQICTGVGLRCPFWKASGCCEFRLLLQRTYDVCKPWYQPWKHHWQQPPCLE